MVTDGGTITEDDSQPIANPLAEILEQNRTRSQTRGQTRVPATPPHRTQPRVPPTQPPGTQQRDQTEQLEQPPAKRLRPFDPPQRRDSLQQRGTTQHQQQHQLNQQRDGDFSALRSDISDMANSFRSAVANTSQTESLKHLVDSFNTSQSRLLGSLEKMMDTKAAGLSPMEEVEPDPTDEDLWFRGTFNIEDNSVDCLNYTVRLGLKNPCADPQSWWIPAQMAPGKKVTPLRGASLFLEHLTGTEGPPPTAVRSLHDRSKFLLTKHLLAKVCKFGYSHFSLKSLF